MTVANFIPKIWAAQMIWDFRQQAWAAQLANREYEGDAQRGNTVHITSGVPVTISDYRTGLVDNGAGGTVPRTTEPEPVASTGQDLLIDQEKSFDFLVDDIDRRQAAGSMDSYSADAAEGLAEDADLFLFASAAAGASAANKLTGAGVAPATGDDAFDILNDLGKQLTKAPNKTPKSQRVAMINAEFAALLTGANSKLTDVDRSGVSETLRDAVLGRLLGFTVIESENLPVTDAPYALTFYRPALAYVSQISETEAMRADKSFSDRLRGLHVYGGKVIRPKNVATWAVGTV